MDVYEVGDISQRQFARNFSVTLRFVHKLLTQYREFGTIELKIRTEKTPIKLTPEQLEILRQLVEEQSNSTLGELQARLQEKAEVLMRNLNRESAGPPASQPNVQRKVSIQPKRAPTKFNLPDLNIGN